MTNYELIKNMSIEDMPKMNVKTFMYMNGYSRPNVEYHTTNQSIFDTREEAEEYELEWLQSNEDRETLDTITFKNPNETGFCHDGFEIEKVITKESVENDLYDFFNDKMETGDAPEIERVGRYPDMYVTGDNGIVVDCIGGKQIRLIIQLD